MVARKLLGPETQFFEIFLKKPEMQIVHDLPEVRRIRQIDGSYEVVMAHEVIVKEVTPHVEKRLKAQQRLYTTFLVRPRVTALPSH